MRINRLVLLISCITIFYIQSNAQDSINYEGKKYRLYREDGKAFVLLPSGEQVIIVEKQPEFPGGVQGLYTYIGKHIKYPKTARKDRIQGLVIVSFIVTKTGSIGRISIVESVRDDIDQEAVRVIQSLPPWKPGTQNDIPVSVRFNLPVQFKL